MDYDEHVEAGEQCFGSRFRWPGVACAFANWPCIGKLFFFPNLSLLVVQSSIYIYIFWLFTFQQPHRTWTKRAPHLLPRGDTGTVRLPETRP